MRLAIYGVTQKMKKISHTSLQPINNTRTTLAQETATQLRCTFLAAFYKDNTMAQSTCKRIWEGTLGVVISPRKKQNGDYFWSFSFVRAFRRTRDSKWEYVKDFGEQHATALGLLMSKAFHFMQENDPVEFLENALNGAAATDASSEVTAKPTLQSVNTTPPDRAAA
jgi:hypothetical protein